MTWHQWRRVADRQQHRPVLGACPREGLVPRLPVDRVLGVLAQVQAGLLREPVHPASIAPLGAPAPAALRYARPVIDPFIAAAEHARPRHGAPLAPGGAARGVVRDG